MKKTIEKIKGIVNELRDDIKVDQICEKDIDILEKLLKSPELGIDSAITEAYIREMRDYFIKGKAPEFSKTRLLAHYRDFDFSFIGGMFQAPYNPDLNIDCLFYKTRKIDPLIQKIYPNNQVVSIEIVECTDGFKHKDSVALFPENFVTNEKVLIENKAFYFIDRFLKRTEQLTLPVIMAMSSPNSFNEIKKADSDLILEGLAVWVHLHEYFHRKGVLPIPEYLHLKSTRSAAALEELRVDILSIIACIDLYKQGLKKAKFYAELIFAERLLRYPVQNDPNSNYDSRSSQIFYSLLLNNGLNIFGDEKLHFDVILIEDILKNINNQLHQQEKIISCLSVVDAKQYVNLMVRSLAGYDYREKSFRTFSFVEKIYEHCISHKISQTLKY